LPLKPRRSQKPLLLLLFSYSRIGGHHRACERGLHDLAGQSSVMAIISRQPIPSAARNTPLLALRPLPTSRPPCQAPTMQQLR
jgi:hypothetical protein